MNVCFLQHTLGRWFCIACYVSAGGRCLVFFPIVESFFSRSIAKSPLSWLKRVCGDLYVNMVEVCSGYGSCFSCFAGRYFYSSQYYICTIPEQGAGEHLHHLDGVACFNPIVTLNVF